jgi:hypothetical protein
MEKRFVFIFVFILVVGLVCAEGAWDSFENESDNVTVPAGNDSIEPAVSSGADFVEFDVGVPVPSSEDSKEFTWEFYMALILSLIVVLIVAYLVYSYIRRHRNSWKVGKK